MYFCADPGGAFLITSLNFTSAFLASLQVFTTAFLNSFQTFSQLLSWPALQHFITAFFAISKCTYSSQNSCEILSKSLSKSDGMFFKHAPSIRFYFGYFHLKVVYSEMNVGSETCVFNSH